jgi:hypothetical protein
MTAGPIIDAAGATACCDATLPVFVPIPSDTDGPDSAAVLDSRATSTAGTVVPSATAGAETIASVDASVVRTPSESTGGAAAGAAASDAVTPAAIVPA